MAMSIWLLAALLLQAPPKPWDPSPSEPPASQTQSQSKKPEKVIVDPDAPRSLKDEDDPDAAKEYTLDPVKAKKEVAVGDFYMRKNSFTAAAKRFEEAAKWQPKLAVAYLKLGQALERKDDPYRAAQAYKKFIELAPGDKQAKELHKKIEMLEKEAEK